MFDNAVLRQYNYNTYYKYWAIRHSILDCDIQNIIFNHTIWYRKEFRISEFNQLTDNYINEYGIVFEKNKIDPVYQSRHYHKDRAVILKLKNDQIEVRAFYDNDIYYDYRINLSKSGIKTINIVKELNQEIKKIPHSHRVYLVTNPLLIAN